MNNEVKNICGLYLTLFRKKEKQLVSSWHLFSFTAIPQVHSYKIPQQVNLWLVKLALYGKTGLREPTKSKYEKQIIFVNTHKPALRLLGPTNGTLMRQSVLQGRWSII